MKRFYYIVAALLAPMILAACLSAPVPEDYASQDEYAAATMDRRAALGSAREIVRDMALRQIEAFNATGVDPIHLKPEYLLGLQTACMVVEVGVAVAGAVSPVRSETVQAACAVILKAAAPAVPPGPGTAG